MYFQRKYTISVSILTVLASFLSLLYMGVSNKRQITIFSSAPIHFSFSFPPPPSLSSSLTLSPSLFQFFLLPLYRTTSFPSLPPFSFLVLSPSLFIDRNGDEWVLVSCVLCFNQMNLVINNEGKCNKLAKLCMRLLNQFLSKHCSPQRYINIQ